MKILKSYAVDVDYNLLFTNSKILLEKKSENWLRELIEVSQSEFDSLIKDKQNYRYVNGNIEDSMINFRGKWRFQQDIFDAIIANKFGPSWDAFLQANRKASPISIITARGHPINDLKKTHKAILYEILEDFYLDELIENMRIQLWKQSPKRKDSVVNTYLDNNYYCPCSDRKFLKDINQNYSTPMDVRKTVAFEKFVEHVLDLYKKYNYPLHNYQKNIRIWFSDDSQTNIEKMEDFVINNLLNKYPNIGFYLYDTKNPHKVVKSSYKKQKK